MARSCTDCGTERPADEPPNTPCPNCGSTKRTITMTVQPISVKFEVSVATLTAIQLWEKLHDTTERLFSAGDYGIALIVAQTASEIVVERAMRKAFDAKKVPELEEPMSKFKPYSLIQDRNRKLYTALTGDDIGKARFWKDYTDFVELRNGSAHFGKVPDKETTRQALDAAKAFVDHVVKNNGL